MTRRRTSTRDLKSQPLTFNTITTEKKQQKNADELREEN